MIVFSNEQKRYIQEGCDVRQSLLDSVEVAITFDGLRKKKRKHTLLYSPTGLGKTRNIKRLCKRKGIAFEVISGKSSLYQMALKLLVLRYLKPDGEPMVIIFDDFDMFFKNQDMMNILKNMIEGEESFTYSVGVNENQLTAIQLEAYNKYKEKYGKGFVVPCDEFVFVVTTNFMLPFDSQVEKAREKDGSSGKADKLDSLAAFRSRFRTHDFHINREVRWGWLSYVLLEDNLIEELSHEQRMIMSEFLWNHRDVMKEMNLRTLEKMADDMLDFPTRYRDMWESYTNREIKF
jgi:hypothetical protein